VITIRLLRNLDGWHTPTDTQYHALAGETIQVEPEVAGLLISSGDAVPVQPAAEAVAA
jgi:hypothetical protein